ncbi:MAG: phosphotransferase [Bacteroidetes bacterium]|nr:phosphotransferase [Bacteroidota bacterium]MBU1720170.1 phosphotransferase [Bacteroidota bacterium]
MTLPRSGSDRQYFRIKAGNCSIIAVYNPDIKENEAFIGFTQHFLKCGLPVPGILKINEQKTGYLLEDLGDTTLFSYLSEKRIQGDFPEEAIGLYRQVIARLPEFQVKASTGLDYSLCYPRPAFDKQSMMWDLNYFKYYFLKLSKTTYNEQLLEDDFQTFTDYLLQAGAEYFLYRDFQSRNVMIHNGDIHFIDYQGGRKGALQYDIASLLYDAKADIPQQVRNMLFEEYLDKLSEHISVDRKQFTDFYQGYILIRIMQAMGAYGFRGVYEKKDHFLQSIPYALSNLEWLLGNISLPVKLPTLMKVLQQLTESKYLQQLARPVLKVNINSFSYRRGIPVDESGNGGGFVFDCRAIHNPGKYDEFKELTGKDPGVQEFLETHTTANDWMNHAFALADHSIDRYIKRGFTHLMIGFGCTGGQHRSVFCAEKMAEHIRTKYDIEVNLRHREQEFREMKGKEK